MLWNVLLIVSGIDIPTKLNTTSVEVPSDVRTLAADLEKNVTQLCLRVTSLPRAAVPISLFQYCESMQLVYKRAMHFFEDATRKENAFFYQMTVAQYDAIALVINEVSSYATPSLLLFGCGRDINLWLRVLADIGGHADIFESDTRWKETCEETVENRSRTFGIKERIVNVAKVANFGLFDIHIALVNSAITHSKTRRPMSCGGKAKNHHCNLREAGQASNETLARFLWLPVPDNVVPNVIVVDGPATAVGTSRLQNMYVALRLALNKTRDEYTHIFVHDPLEYIRDSARLVFGLNHGSYLGNIDKRKGLLHFRIRGENLPRPAQAYPHAADAAIRAVGLEPANITSYRIDHWWRLYIKKFGHEYDGNGAVFEA